MPGENIITFKGCISNTQPSEYFDENFLNNPLFELLPEGYDVCYEMLINDELIAPHFYLYDSTSPLNKFDYDHVIASVFIHFDKPTFGWTGWTPWENRAHIPELRTNDNLEGFDLRRAGIGTFLILCSIAYAKSYGINIITLYDASAGFRTEHNIYRKLGFEYLDESGHEMAGDINVIYSKLPIFMELKGERFTNKLNELSEYFDDEEWEPSDMEMDGGVGTPPEQRGIEARDRWLNDMRRRFQESINNGTPNMELAQLIMRNTQIDPTAVRVRPLTRDERRRQPRTLGRNTRPPPNTERTPLVTRIVRPGEDINHLPRLQAELVKKKDSIDSPPDSPDRGQQRMEAARDIQRRFRGNRQRRKLTKRSPRHGKKQEPATHREQMRRWMDLSNQFDQDDPVKGYLNPFTQKGGVGYSITDTSNTREDIERKLILGADPNEVHPNTRGQTLLFAVVNTLNIPLVKLLLDYGADPFHKDDLGSTVYDYIKYDLIHYPKRKEKLKQITKMIANKINKPYPNRSYPADIYNLVELEKMREKYMYDDEIESPDKAEIINESAKNIQKIFRGNRQRRKLTKRTPRYGKMQEPTTKREKMRRWTLLSKQFEHDDPIRGYERFTIAPEKASEAAEAAALAAQDRDSVSRLSSQRSDGSANSDSSLSPGFEYESPDLEEEAFQVKKTMKKKRGGTGTPNENLLGDDLQNLFNHEEAYLWPENPSVQVNDDELESVDIYDMPVEVMGNIASHLNFDNCEELRNYCLINPRECALDEKFKEKYGIDIQLCKNEAIIKKSSKRFFQLEPSSELLERMNGPRGFYEFGDEGLNTIEYKLPYPRFAGKMLTDIFREQGIFFQIQKQKSLRALIKVTFMDIVLFFHKEDPRLLDSILDQWVNEVIKKKEKLEQALKNNYMNHPEPVEENWSWNPRHSHWIYSKWLYETNEVDILLLQKIFLDSMSNYLEEEELFGIIDDY